MRRGWSDGRWAGRTSRLSSIKHITPLKFSIAVGSFYFRDVSLTGFSAEPLPAPRHIAGTVPALPGQFAPRTPRTGIAGRRTPHGRGRRRPAVTCHRAAGMVSLGGRRCLPHRDHARSPRARGDGRLRHVPTASFVRKACRKARSISAATILRRPRSAPEMPDRRIRIPTLFSPQTVCQRSAGHTRWCLDLVKRSGSERLYLRPRQAASVFRRFIQIPAHISSAKRALPVSVPPNSGCTDPANASVTGSDGLVRSQTWPSLSSAVSRRDTGAARPMCRYAPPVSAGSVLCAESQRGRRGYEADHVFLSSR